MLLVGAPVVVARTLVHSHYPLDAGGVCFEGGGKGPRTLRAFGAWLKTG